MKTRDVSAVEVANNAEERRAIASLKRLARRWPATLMLHSSGSLTVVRCDTYARDPRAAVEEGESILGISSDGGDP